MNVVVFASTVPLVLNGPDVPEVDRCTSKEVSSIALSVRPSETSLAVTPVTIRADGAGGGGGSVVAHATDVKLEGPTLLTARTW